MQPCILVVYISQRQETVSSCWQGPWITLLPSKLPVLRIPGVPVASHQANRPSKSPQMWGDVCQGSLFLQDPTAAETNAARCSDAQKSHCADHPCNRPGARPQGRQPNTRGAAHQIHAGAKRPRGNAYFLHILFSYFMVRAFRAGYISFHGKHEIGNLFFIFLSYLFHIFLYFP